VDVIGDVIARVIVAVLVHGNPTVILIDLPSTRLTSSKVGITIRVAFPFKRTSTITVAITITSAITP
jgi:hypothetical protein